MWWSEELSIVCTQKTHCNLSKIEHMTAYDSGLVHQCKLTMSSKVVDDNSERRFPITLLNNTFTQESSTKRGLIRSGYFLLPHYPLVMSYVIYIVPAYFHLNYLLDSLFWVAPDITYIVLC